MEITHKMGMTVVSYYTLTTMNPLTFQLAERVTLGGLFSAADIRGCDLPDVRVKVTTFGRRGTYVARNYDGGQPANRDVCDF